MGLKWEDLAVGPIHCHTCGRSFGENEYLPAVSQASWLRLAQDGYKLPRLRGIPSRHKEYYICENCLHSIAEQKVNSLIQPVETTTSLQKMITLTEDMFELSHEFVAVRQSCDKIAGGFFSLFRKIDFQELYESAELIKTKITAKAKEIDKISESQIAVANAQESKLFQLLEDYKISLVNASSLHAEKMDLAKKRAQNKAHISMSDIIEISRKEKASLEKCQRAGDDLTNFYRQLC